MVVEGFEHGLKGGWSEHRGVRKDKTNLSDGERDKGLGRIDAENGNTIMR